MNLKGLFYCICEYEKSLKYRLLGYWRKKLKGTKGMSNMNQGQEMFHNFFMEREAMHHFASRL